MKKISIRDLKAQLSAAVADAERRVEDVPISEALGPRKVVPLELYREAEVFFG